MQLRSPLLTKPGLGLTDKLFKYNTERSKPRLTDYRGFFLRLRGSEFVDNRLDLREIQSTEADDPSIVVDIAYNSVSISIPG